MKPSEVRNLVFKGAVEGNLEVHCDRFLKGGRHQGLSKKAQNKAIIAERLYLDGELSVNDI
jgi:hypothetical protein